MGWATTPTLYREASIKQLCPTSLRPARLRGFWLLPSDFWGPPWLPVVFNTLPWPRVPVPPGRLGLTSPERPAAATGGGQGVHPRTQQTRGAPRLTRRADSGENARLAPQLPRPLQREGHPPVGMRVLLTRGGTGGCEQSTGHRGRLDAGNRLFAAVVGNPK